MQRKDSGYIGQMRLKTVMKQDMQRVIVVVAGDRVRWSYDDPLQRHQEKTTERSPSNLSWNLEIK